MKRLCIFCVAMLLVVSAASAQDFRGAIAGTVSDSSGGRTPGVTVSAVNVATNGTTTTTTDSEGGYTLRYLTPGTYSVTAELSGFKKLVRENVEVRIGDRLELDLRLEVGSMEET
ncbi:MAG: carboxypeptidase-like regulatory domain-containing protein, partial [Acidobacteriota bacterium]